ncbi:chaperonin 10-like protein [Apodospora peruviana]|uniref:Chaperonin 10-like protein n=1 Tax=Apodospora peruviana TaxID=516989 RepID=A0AAE0HSL2_9PEZI|nr:chaperonin 10-like protein [Apodospora peruviana]
MAITQPPELPKSMFAWRKHRGNPEPVWEEVPVPEAPPTGVVVKLLASGVCRSDHSLLTLEKQAAWFQDKWTLGHEGCGKIVRFGSEVKNTQFKIGDVVALHSVPGCGDEQTCPECSRNLAQICETGHHSGIGQDGYYAPYAAIDVRGLVAVPEGVTPAEAAVATDAVQTAYHAIVRRAEVNPTETVFLFGLGGLGFNALQIVRHIGARIIVCDVKQARLDEAAKIGLPKEDIVPIGKSPVEFVEERGLKIDTVLDFCGTHQTFDDAQYIVRRGGKILCVGSIDAENTVHMKIGTRKRLTFIFTYGGQHGDLAEVLQLIKEGVIRPQVIPGKLEDFPRVLRDLEEGKIEGRVALLHDE